MQDNVCLDLFAWMIRISLGRPRLLTLAAPSTQTRAQHALWSLVLHYQPPLTDDYDYSTVHYIRTASKSTNKRRPTTITQSGDSHASVGYPSQLPHLTLEGGGQHTRQART